MALLRDRLIADIGTLGSRQACVTATMDILDRLETTGIDGDFVECGVWTGAQPILAKAYVDANGYRPRRYWLFDTFDGMPECGPEDRNFRGAYPRSKPKGWLLATRAEVQHNFAVRGLLDEDQVIFVEGMVEMTLLDHWHLPERICYLRLDTDFYSSTRAALHALYPRLESGGALVIDDYGWWMGAAQATDEFAPIRGLPMEEIDRSARLIWKP